MFCSKCGSEVNDEESFCGVCGNSLKETMPAKDVSTEPVPQNTVPNQIANPEAPSININLNQNQQNHASMGMAFANPPQELKSKEVTGLLCIFLGWLGIHDFYVGKNNSRSCQTYTHLPCCFLVYCRNLGNYRFNLHYKRLVLRSLGTPSHRKCAPNKVFGVSTIRSIYPANRRNNYSFGWGS
jgi:TM2 domain.